MRFITKNKARMKIRNRISFVSIHIPKTAGTAFRLILNESIPAKNFAKVDIQPSGRIRVNDQIFKSNKLGKSVSHIHGHFSYKDLHENFELDPEVEYITWVRDPVERVLSNYYFLKRIIEERLKEQEDENLWPRMGKSLEEYVALEENQNVMSRFLEGAPLDSFKFIGLQDHYSEDLKHLQELMNWPQLQSEVHNSTQRKNKQHEARLLNLIKEVNAQDMELYSRIKALKGKGN